jgi:hypothetical protein
MHNRAKCVLRVFAEDLRVHKGRQRVVTRRRGRGKNSFCPVSPEPLVFFICVTWKEQKGMKTISVYEVADVWSVS